MYLTHCFTFFKEGNFIRNDFELTFMKYPESEIARWLKIRVQLDISRNKSAGKKNPRSIPRGYTNNFRPLKKLFYFSTNFKIFFSVAYRRLKLYFETLNQGLEQFYVLKN